LDFSATSTTKTKSRSMKTQVLCLPFQPDTSTTPWASAWYHHLDNILVGIGFNLDSFFFLSFFFLFVFLPSRPPLSYSLLSLSSVISFLPGERLPAQSQLRDGGVGTNVFIGNHDSSPQGDCTIKAQYSCISFILWRVVVWKKMDSGDGVEGRPERGGAAAGGEVLTSIFRWFVRNYQPETSDWKHAKHQISTEMFEFWEKWSGIAMS